MCAAGSILQSLSLGRAGPAPEAADEAPAAEDADGRVKGAAAEERDDRESEAAAG